MYDSELEHARPVFNTWDAWRIKLVIHDVHILPARLCLRLPVDVAIGKMEDGWEMETMNECALLE